MDAVQAMELLNWKRRVSLLYAEIRQDPSPAEAWDLWRRTRDDLFRTHPQSPLPDADRDDFAGLNYFDYDERWRVVASLQPCEPERFEIPTSGDEPMTFERVGVVRFDAGDGIIELPAYWLTAYGGGLFLPFRDTTGGASTYGAGRYLLDTVKGADLGSQEGGLVLDFNFAYNPSCSYDPRWVCPLAPPANRLDVRIEAGERL